ncbi:MAG TPA: hypothetical protein VIA02_04585, partial [Candidatus Limnocylindria bacterium]
MGSSSTPGSVGAAESLGAAAGSEGAGGAEAGASDVVGAGWGVAPVRICTTSFASNIGSPIGGEVMATESAGEV